MAVMEEVKTVKTALSAPSSFPSIRVAARIRLADRAPRIAIAPFFPPAAALGEFRLRAINDEINKLLREKHHWNKRILELGGPNHMV